MKGFVRISATGVLAALAMVSSAAAEPTLGELRRSTGEERGFQMIYLLGLVAAYGSANAALIDRGVPPLYCAPERLSLTVDQVERIVTLFADRSPGIEDADSLPIVTLFALEDVFPCQNRIRPFEGLPATLPPPK